MIHDIRGSELSLQPTWPAHTSRHLDKTYRVVVCAALALILAESQRQAQTREYQNRRVRSSKHKGSPVNENIAALGRFLRGLELGPCAGVARGGLRGRGRRGRGGGCGGRSDDADGSRGARLHQPRRHDFVRIIFR